MVVKIDIPDDAGALLTQAFGVNLTRPTLEGMASEGYRSGRLSRYEVQKILGFDNRWETEEWLASHGFELHYSVADLEADRETLDTILGPVRK